MRIVIVASSTESLVKFRGHLIKEWIKRGNEVCCISIECATDVQEMLNQLGNVSYYQVAGSRTGTSIVEGFQMIQRYKKTFQQIRPDACFLYMSKPIAFGGIAALLCQIPHIYIFQTGLDIPFYSKGIKNFIIRQVLKLLYGYVQRRAEAVIFMCHEDEKKMLKWGLVKEKQTFYVDGSGVDMDKFSKQVLPEEPIVLMVARLVWSKGVREYIEAARTVKQQYPKTRFLLVGGLDENSEALNKEELNQIVHEGVVEYLGYQNDVRPFLKMCSIFVLPSYHEGKGTAILEAQAIGRPIITTTAPGCSETVIEGYNGMLVPPKDSEALANAIIHLVVDKNLRQKMANNAYDFCSRTFDSRMICEKICKIMRL